MWGAVEGERGLLEGQGWGEERRGGCEIKGQTKVTPDADDHSGSDAWSYVNPGLTHGLISRYRMDRNLPSSFLFL